MSQIVEPWPHIQRADALDSSRFGRAPFRELSHPCPLGRASDCDTGWADYLMSAASARPRAHAHARPPLAARRRTADTKSCPAVTRHQHLVAGESGCVREGPVNEGDGWRSCHGAFLARIGVSVLMSPVPLRAGTGDAGSWWCRAGRAREVAGATHLVQWRVQRFRPVPLQRARCWCGRGHAGPNHRSAPR